MGVLGEDADGNLYRLRDGTFSIANAATLVEVVGTEDFGEPVDGIEVEVSSGTYDVQLEDGWRMERWDSMTGSSEDVVAVLTSDNPAQATVLDETTSRVAFRFFIDGSGPVDMGGAGIEIDIDPSARCSEVVQPDACDALQSCRWEADDCVSATSPGGPCQSDSDCGGEFCDVAEAQCVPCLDAGPIAFEDSNLKAAVLEMLGRGGEDVASAVISVESVTLAILEDPSLSLRAEDRGISSLRGMECMDDLRSVYLNANEVSDVSPLGALAELRVLELEGNALTTVDALGSLSNLLSVNLSGNQIERVDALAGAVELRVLSVFSNQITDISALDALTNLTFLGLGGNPSSTMSTPDVCATVPATIDASVSGC